MGERSPRPGHPCVTPLRRRTLCVLGQLQAVFRVFPKDVGLLHDMKLVTTAQNTINGYLKLIPLPPALASRNKAVDPARTAKISAEELFAGHGVGALRLRRVHRKTSVARAM